MPKTRISKFIAIVVSITVMLTASAFLFVPSFFGSSLIINAQSATNAETSDWINITRAADLFLIEDSQNLHRNFRLINNIDLDVDNSWHGYVDNIESGWRPIDAYNNRGLFNGGGFSVYNLRINRPNQRYVGLFARMQLQVQNFNIIEADIVGGDIAGILSAIAFSRIYNVSADGTVEASSIVGGLVGISYSNIGRSSFEGEVKGVVVGGLVGNVRLGSVSNSFAYADIVGRTMGGLVAILDEGSGLTPARIENVIAFSRLTICSENQGLLRLGGLIGILDEYAFIDNTYSLMYYAPIAQGEAFSVFTLSQFEFTVLDNFDLDFDRVWYYDELANFPRLRQLFLNITTNSRSIAGSTLIARDFFHYGEEFALNFDMAQAVPISITINGSDRTTLLNGSEMFYSVYGVENIHVEFEFLAQVFVFIEGEGRAQASQRFYSAGQTVVIEITEIEGYEFYSIAAYFNHLGIELTSSVNAFSFIITEQIIEGDSISFFVNFAQAQGGGLHIAILLLIIILPIIILGIVAFIVIRKKLLSKSGGNKHEKTT